MKKIITFIIAMMLIASMAVPAFAATPSYQFPELPEIPDISDDIKFELPDSIWDKWFNEHPINWKPVVKIELPDDFWGNVKLDFFGG